MAIKPKLIVDVNHNPTKKGIKVQFALPQTLEGDAKAAATQKLQAKLNQGLEQYNLTVSQDTDVPYSNVIGFLIPIADVKLLIKKALGMGEEGQGEQAPEEMPTPEAAPEELVKENTTFTNYRRSFKNVGGVRYNDEAKDELEKEGNDLNELAPYILKLGDFVGKDEKGEYFIYKNGQVQGHFKDAKNFLFNIWHSVKEMKRMQKLAGVKEAFDPFLDTELGGYMREYIDQVAEEEGLDLSYRDDFDQAFDMAFVLLNNEHPELRSNIKSILAHRESFF